MRQPTGGVRSLAGEVYTVNRIRSSLFILVVALLTQAVSGCASKSMEGATAEQLYDMGMNRLKSHEAKWYQMPKWGLETGETRKYFTELRRRFPASQLVPLATLRIADTYYLDENWSEAYTYYDEFIANLVNYPAYQGELDRARERKNHCAGLMLTAEKLYAEGMERMEFYRRGIRWNPANWKWGDHPLSHWSYDAEDTRKVFQEIRTKFPVSKEAPLALLRIGDTYFEDEMFTEALVYYDEFVKSHPAYREEGAYAQLRKAQCYSRQILKADQDPSAALNTRDAYVSLQRDYEGTPEALEAGDELRRVNLEIGEQEAFVGDFYYRRSEYRAAIGRYRGLVEQFPEHPLIGWALLRLGMSHQALGEYAAARDLYSRALSAPSEWFRNPDDVKFMDAYVLFLAYPNADATQAKVHRRAKLQLAILDLLQTSQPASEAPVLQN